MLTPTLYKRGAAGIPSTSLMLPDIRGSLTSIGWSITDQFGFESADLTIVGGVEEFLSWANELGASLLIFGPNAQTCWEGQLTEVSATLGQERHSRSLDGMANRVNCRYTTVNGVPGSTGSSSDTTSQALYGIKDGIVSLNVTTSTGATALRDRTLDKRRFPVRRPSSTAATGDLGGIEITLHFTGWYGTLDWVLTSSSTTATAVTSTQVGTLLTNIAAVNAFISTSTANIAASGVSDTQFIAADTTYRSKIEDLLGQGTSGPYRYAWGVYDDRVFAAQVWAGATPSTITYRRPLGSGMVMNSAGAVVDPWDLRPNAMYQIDDLLELNPASNEQDSAARYYVARTTFRMDSSGFSATLEPSDSDDLSAQLLRLEAMQ
jgi:hypothetical protein